MQQPAEVAESGQPRRGQSQQAGRSYGVWAIPALIALGIFLLWPLGTLIWRGISLDGSLTDAFIRNFATERFYWERLWFTIWQALASTALTSRSASASSSSAAMRNSTPLSASNHHLEFSVSSRCAAGDISSSRLASSRPRFGSVVTM